MPRGSPLDHPEGRRRLTKRGMKRREGPARKLGQRTRTHRNSPARVTDADAWAPAVGQPHVRSGGPRGCAARLTRLGGAGAAQRRAAACQSSATWAGMVQESATPLAMRVSGCGSGNCAIVLTTLWRGVLCPESPWSTAWQMGMPPSGSATLASGGVGITATTSTWQQAASHITAKRMAELIAPQQ